MSDGPEYHSFSISSELFSTLTPSIAARGRNVVFAELKPADTRKGRRASTISLYRWTSKSTYKGQLSGLMMHMLMISPSPAC